MKTISVSVSEVDYEAFRVAARRRERPIAELIREAMALYRAEKLTPRTRCEDLVVLTGHRPVHELPTREELYDEVFGSRGAG